MSTTNPSKWKIDTGASLSIISKETFDNTFADCTLKPSNISLSTYTGVALTVHGMMVAEVQHISQSAMLPILVVDGTGPSLLGRNWLQKIKLNWLLICSVNRTTQTDNVLRKHSELFCEELGCLNTSTAKIYISSDAQPKFYKARPVPYSLKHKVEEELRRLEKQGIITSVTCAKWATPVVPVLKTNGNVRLCGDYKVTINKYLQSPKIEGIYLQCLVVVRCSPR